MDKELMNSLTKLDNIVIKLVYDNPNITYTSIMSEISPLEEYKNDKNQPIVMSKLFNKLIRLNILKLTVKDNHSRYELTTEFKREYKLKCILKK